MARPLSKCLCCNMVYLVEGWVLLIEFLPSDMGPIATCVRADTGCQKPNTGAQVVQQGGEWPIMIVSAPSVIWNSAFLLSGALQNRASLSLTNRGGDKLSLYMSFFNFILFLSSNYNWDFIHHLKKKTKFKASFCKKMKRLLKKKKPWMWSCCLCLCFVILSEG